MKSAARGTRTSGAEVTNVSRHGIWLLLDARECFLSFKHFPWFEHATIGQISRVERPQAGHLYWPELDVDVAVDSIDHPEEYPLVSKVSAVREAKRPVTRPTERPVTRPTNRPRR